MKILKDLPKSFCPIGIKEVCHSNNTSMCYYEEAPAISNFHQIFQE